jgi:hypothetical protein
MLRFVASFIWILSFLLAGQAARAQSVSLGLLLGPAIRSEDGTALGFELKGGYRFLPTIETQLYYWRVNSGADLSGGDTSVSATETLSSFGAEALYAFPGSNWSAGAKLGFAKNSKDGKASSSAANGASGNTITLSESKTSLVVTPTVVYEVPLSFMLVGGEAAYFYSLSSSVPKALSLMVEGRVRF